MIIRRRFLHGLDACLSVPVTGCNSFAGSSNEKKVVETTWLMPDESAPHAATWMAFGARVDIWREELLPGVQDNLALIARTIAKYEPVKMLVREAEYDIAKAKCGDSVELIVTTLDDLWIRDTGPVFVRDKNDEPAGVNFNFNGWGEKQVFANDTGVAEFITNSVKVKTINTDLVLEGGGIEVDGEGTAIATESCILNPNRNPGLSKTDCESELKFLLGVEKVIWLPGIADKDITDGHTDFYARFVHPGVVINSIQQDPGIYDYDTTREHLGILQSATDAKGRPLKVVPLEVPKNIRPEYANDEFAAGYVGFYVLNDAVIAQQFGDETSDEKARKTLQELFPNRTIEMLNVDAIAAGGGSIHCTTQQQPAS